MNLNSLLQCTGCQSDLVPKGGPDELSWLICNECNRRTPVIKDFVLFTETVENSDDPSGSVPGSLLESFGPRADEFETYMKQRADRGILEVYAAQQPFNESTRSFYPFVEELRKRLNPGDTIIDASARTGWHSLLLSALFPEQQVYGIWEGNIGVLGYSGFANWFSKSRRPPNLEIVFSDPAKPLPFKDQTVDLIFAYDVVHHNKFPFYVEELLRVARTNGTILLSHIHMANNEPSPYFDRGGTIRHGTFYDKEINALIKENDRKCLILAEVELFDHSGTGPVRDAKEGEDYNGFGIIAEESWLRQEFTNCLDRGAAGDSRLLINPLQTVNPFNGRILFNENALSGKLRAYIRRHPCYESRLAEIEESEKVDADAIALLLSVDSASTIADYSDRLGWDLSHCVEVANRLQKLELVAALPVSKTAIELQDFYTNQHKLFPGRFAGYWSSLLVDSPDESILELEGKPITTEETHQLLCAFAAYYKSEGTDQGQRITIDEAQGKTELMIAMMAAWWIGCTPVLSKKVSETDSDFWSIINEHIGSDIDPPEGSTADQVNDTIWYKALFIPEGKGRADSIGSS